tara:strand:+ start:1579 stop:2388 length:810 start_codon:yes stop_codon:yes gene_type:complete
MTKTDRFCVIGDPVFHSKSPQIHEAFARQINKQIQYDKVLVSRGELKNFLLENKDTVEGINVTIPLKEEAWDACDFLTDRAKKARAVNTLWEEHGLWFGDNTDGVGFIKDLNDNLAFNARNKNIFFVGSGGAVKGVLNPLIDCSPCSIYIYGRNELTAKKLVSETDDGRVLLHNEIKKKTIKFDLIVNSTPASLYGKMPEMPEIEFNENAIFYDMSYGVKSTPFQEYGISKGYHSVDGLGMLVEQAGFSFFQWHGRHPKTKEVLDALRL